MRRSPRDGTLSIDGDEIHLVHDSDLCPDEPHPKETDILLEGVAVHGELKAWLRRG
ncbi:hypothetical protein [Mesorhizobium sp. WSM1293]|uniref:hypothetical protein n=1 Tax=Mesorhizobium sp. WSM1293 TaxID=1040984 RepID=UPI0004B05806|nr:hypothetical protein [Mesorhizobium sp. WSM1293]